MSCIVGVIDNGKVWMGADSAGVGLGKELQLRRDAKVFVNGPYLIGTVGSFAISNQLRFASLGPSGDGDPFRQMVTVFLPFLRGAIEGLEGENFELLVGLRGRLFHVYNIWQVAEEEARFDAAGSGAQVARGALWATRCEPHISPEVRIKLALQAAERFCTEVSGPFTIVSEVVQ